MNRISMGVGPLRRVVGEPLLQFLLLGAAIYGGAQLWSFARETAAQRIVIDAPLVAHQRSLYRVQFGADPDAATMASLLESYARDEALYREGQKLGLGNEDEIIRQRVIQKMETLLTDATVLPTPDEATLVKYLHEHADRYTRPATLSFTQLFFTTETTRSGQTQQRAIAALRQLQRGLSPQRVGADVFALGDEHNNLDATALRRRFGDSQLADAASTAPLRQWSGPWRSGYGWHLILVTERSPAIVPSMQAGHDALRDAVREDWQEEHRTTSLHDAVEAVLQKYTVQRRDLGAGE